MKTTIAEILSVKNNGRMDDSSVFTKLSIIVLTFRLLPFVNTAK